MVRNLSLSPSFFPPLTPNFYFKSIMEAWIFMPEKIKVFDGLLRGKIQMKNVKKNS